MRNEHTIAVIIPVLNEAESIGKVVAAIPKWVDDIIVVDNGSTDGTDAVAIKAGARVVSEPQRGYGAACLAGMAALQDPDIVVFLDGDYSDYPEEMPLLVDPIVHGDVDFMVGSRVRGERERGALTPQAHFGNWLATKLIRLFWGIRYTDLGPFRAIRYRTLLQLGMVDQDYGWTVEMQIKAALHAVAADEVPVSYRKRVGVSKVSGTVRGVVGAGYKILSTILFSALFSRHTLKTELLVFFTRYPEAGTTKTRLIPALGPEGAAEFQRQMTEHCLEIAPPVRPEVDIQVQYMGADRGEMVAWLGPIPLYAPQGEGDLGERMARAFEMGFEQAYGKVIIVGTDCPALDSAVTTEAFAALDDHDMVIGPAADGGYYLIGLTMHTAPEDLDTLFMDMAWGTDSVLGTTRTRAAEANLKVAELRTLGDVDYPEDLPRWGAAQSGNRLAVIIPVLNEADRIGALLETLKAIENGEIIVVDGGSADKTVEIARKLGATIVNAPPGRACQMNAGVLATEAERLLFLHADSRLPRDAAAWVRRTLSFEEVSIGAFELRIDGPGTAFRWLEWTANLRSRMLGVPYGDQGLFMSRESYEALGGYRAMPILEDYDLVRRASKIGQVVTVPARISTSSRRWLREGVVWLTLKNVTTFFAYPMGVGADRIAGWYGRKSDSAPHQ